MKAVQVHQLLHGYRRGHRLLSGSISLSQEQIELVTRLSDLSGLLTNDTTFDEYITSYPLPNSNFYALARTWPDNQASRDGCIITHTLLIPKDTWGTVLEPRNFTKLFELPKGDIDNTDLHNKMRCCM